jgi:hypothetical protein
MSVAVTGWNSARQPVDTANPSSSRCAGVGHVRSASCANGVACPSTGSLHLGPHGVDAVHPGDGSMETLICNSLRGCSAARAMTASPISTTKIKDVTILFFSALRFVGKVTEGLDLARRLLQSPAHGHGNFSKGSLQFGFDDGSSAKTKRPSAPRGRGCSSLLRVDRAGVRRGVAFAKSPGRLPATRA